MSRPRGLLSVFAPGVVVFISSGCIMTIELTASRLIAREVGSSLYTWTSVLGVVLSGVAVGSYLGGRIADRSSSNRTLAGLLGISSLTCVTIIVLNNLMSNWIWLWKLSWPVHVPSRVSLLLFVPSVSLGTITPVAVKMALGRQLRRGETLGRMYAFGAVGGIAGTFLAGFYLIAAMGTAVTIWTVAAILSFAALLWQPRALTLYSWAVLLAVSVTLAVSPSKWAQRAGVALALREMPDARILYEDETQYCHIEVRRILRRPDLREFVQDKLVHGSLIMGDIDDLQYPYMSVFAAVTHGLCTGKERIFVMVIGGGGYVFPRYVEKHWRGSSIDVVEIDPGVTKAAVEAFGLQKDSTINTVTMDARSYVDQLLGKKRNGRTVPRYDFVYGDAVNDYSVPHQLVTKEFHDKIAEILTDKGVYLVNLIDIFESGRLLGSVVNTLRKTFPCVYVLSQVAPTDVHNTFVVVATKERMAVGDLVGNAVRDMDIWCLDDAEISELIRRSGGVFLTDDYAPVEHLLAPVVCRSAALVLRERAGREVRRGRH